MDATTLDRPSVTDGRAGSSPQASGHHGCREVVFMIHGLWMGRWIMAPLATRLRRAGMETRLFGYHTVTRSSDRLVDELGAALAEIDADVIHIVAHSLGGLLVGAHLLGPAPDPRIDRIVTIGTPHHGSALARAFTRHRLGRVLVGANSALLRTGLPGWPRDRPTLNIAGTRRIGLDLIFRTLPHPNDGIVSTRETRLPPPARNVRFHLNHSGLLFSRQVARCVIDFLHPTRALQAPKPIA
ncbi:MAG: alpha/beta hydrolase [Halothiobacillaceae bacterium]